MVWMPSTRVTNQASKVTDNVSGQPSAIPAVYQPTIPAGEVPRPPEEIPPTPVWWSSRQTRPPMRYGYPISLKLNSLMTLIYCDV